MVLYGLVLGSPVESQELDLMILMGPFQLKIFYVESSSLVCSHIPLSFEHDAQTAST